LFKSQLKSRHYNKANTNVGDGDGDASVGDRDDAQSSKDSDGGEDWFAFASSSLRSLPEVRLLQVLVLMNVRSLIYPHRVKVFDEAMLMVHGMVGWYRLAPVIPMPVKASNAWLLG
jgi:hypothetical protein